MRPSSGKSRTSPRSNSTGLWFKGLAVCSPALVGHLIVRSLITGVRDGTLSLFARPSLGSLTISVEAGPAYTGQVLQNIYHHALIASYYFTAGVLGLGLVVLIAGMIGVFRRG